MWPHGRRHMYWNFPVKTSPFSISTAMTSFLLRQKLQECLQSHFETDAEIRTTVATLVPKGTGFMSDVNIVSITWNDDNYCELLPKSVVIKTPSTVNVTELATAANCDDLTNEDGREMLETMVQLLHEAECRAYEILRQLSSPPIPSPRIFGVDPSMIIMEDLSREGCIFSDVIGISFEQWRSVIIHMARFHAWALTTELDWKTSMNENLKVKKYIVDSSREYSKSNLRMIREKYADYFGDLDEELFEKVTSWEAMVEHDMLYQKIMPQVITHGDTWINNIFFEYDPKAPGTAANDVLVFIDWQTSSIGCGLTDLAHLAAWCVPVQLKRSRTSEILRIYFEELQLNCSSICNGQLTMDDVLRLYQHALAVEELILVPYLEIFKILTKVDLDETGQREKQVLEHIRYSYDEAVQYFEYRTKNGIVHL